MDKIAQRTETNASLSFEELAAQQGVTPVDDFETLLGARLPEDESAEDFAASLREWRRVASPDTCRHPNSDKITPSPATT